MDTLPRRYESHTAPAPIGHIALVSIAIASRTSVTTMVSVRYAGWRPTRAAAVRLARRTRDEYIARAEALHALIDAADRQRSA